MSVLQNPIYMYHPPINPQKLAKSKQQELVTTKAGLHFVAISAELVYISILWLQAKNFPCNILSSELKQSETLKSTWF